MYIKQSHLHGKETMAVSYNGQRNGVKYYIYHGRLPQNTRIIYAQMSINSITLTPQQKIRFRRFLVANGCTDIMIRDGRSGSKYFPYISFQVPALDRPSFPWEDSVPFMEQRNDIAVQGYEYAMEPQVSSRTVTRHGDVTEHDVRGHDRVLRSAHWGDRQGERVKVKPHKRGKAPAYSTPW